MLTPTAIENTRALALTGRAASQAVPAATTMRITLVGPQLTTKIALQRAIAALRIPAGALTTRATASGRKQNRKTGLLKARAVPPEKRVDDPARVPGAHVSAVDKVVWLAVEFIDGRH